VRDSDSAEEMGNEARPRRRRLSTLDKLSFDGRGTHKAVLGAHASQAAGGALLRKSVAVQLVPSKRDGGGKKRKGRWVLQGG